MSLKSKIVQFFPIPCPLCKAGKLHVVNIHITTFWGKLNVYECDKCKKKFV